MEFDKIQKIVLSLPDHQLALIKKAIIQELKYQAGDYRAKSIFWNILKRSFNRYNIKCTDQEIISRLQDYTESQFCNFRGVGKDVLRVAKSEMELYNVTFKK